MMPSIEYRYACFKRCLDFYVADPSFRTLMDKDSRQAVKSLGYEKLINSRDVYNAIRYVAYGGKSNKDEQNEFICEYIKRLEVLAAYSGGAVAESRFLDKSLCYFGQLVRNRCRMESADIRDHSLIRYFPVAFELSDGCSVQCDFCGFSAGKLRGIFNHDSSNSGLWKSVLLHTKEIIGRVVGSCPCYFATEPFDNPGYEDFIMDFYDVFGEFPQTTTAVCERDPEITQKEQSTAFPV